MLADDGVRVMTYINPFLADNIAKYKVRVLLVALEISQSQPDARRNLFLEAAEAGYLVKVSTCVHMASDSSLAFINGSHHIYFGSLSQNTSGEPYIMFSVTPEFTFGMVDFTNPDAVQWYAAVIQSNMLGFGQVSLSSGGDYSSDSSQSGWMADFAEYLPFDSQISSSSLSPATVHNLYPQLWSEVNKLATSNNVRVITIAKLA
jgi:hypothetical protein